MAIISETSDNVSYSGGPNDQEEEEVENLDHVTPYIPEELCEITVARVQRCHYPRLSLLSKAFRDVISSEQLFVTRSDLGVTEPVLYTLISSPPFDPPSWYILHRSNISLRLSRVTSLPPMFPGCTAVTIGHKIYVMGGCTGVNQPIKTVIVIDCRFHKWECVKSMKRERCYAASGVIDGKIYVVGGRKKRYNDWVEVFDVENGVWETVPGPYIPFASSSGMFLIHVVLDDKIYVLDDEYCFAYDPRRRRWGSWGIGSTQRDFWHASSCVVDDFLYAIDTLWSLGSLIVVYDPRDMVWRPVKGVDHLPSLVYIESKMASFGGKLVILGPCQRPYYHLGIDVWCVEVALEKREDGDILGKVESVSPVYSSFKWPFIEISRTVTV
ncbi:putative F-box/kelch-repeat protein At2g29810 isoform X3 [Capsella rubella]|uniref:putative F-box/kelch-repeat protein At2g29810 isoform X3 n=1 Tax=Capsella rubella TaxID=81985 RepID=UPI000CD50E87|nr:putative F-box/kelch-repeat protein At2g29810 isoform X3 [Capsella rubella]